MDICFDEVSEELQKHYFAFAKFWSKTSFQSDAKIQTVSLTTDPILKSIVLKINPEFWRLSSLDEKVFYVCHEATHLVLGHHWRAAELPNKQIANIAADLVVNELLKNDLNYDFLGFDHYPFFLADVLPNEPTHETLEYYYKKLQMIELPSPESTGKGQDKSSSNQADSDDNGEGEEEASEDETNNTDEAEGNGGESETESNSDLNGKPRSPSMSENLEALDADSLNDLVQALDEGEKEEIKKMVGAQAGNVFLNFVNEKKPRKKRKWESVIKKWTQSSLSDFAESPSWTKEHKRASALMQDCMLPFDDENEDLLKNRIDLVFFMDTSGSCISLASRFFKAAASLDRKKFNIKLFCFDTRIFEVSLSNPKAMGGGGTRFDILEKKLQEFDKYPAAVFMITDGYGDNISPEYPKRWHIFLTDYSTKRCFPSLVNFYELKSFE